VVRIGRAFFKLLNAEEPIVFLAYVSGYPFYDLKVLNLSLENLLVLAVLFYFLLLICL
jgi:hypothetical protein